MNIRASSSFVPGNIAAVLDRIAARNLAATTRATELVMNAAKERAPTRSGELQAGIEMVVTLEGTNVTGYVVSTSDHGGFVEYGTGIRGRGTYPYELPTEGVPYTGSWVYDYKQQNWEGHEAQPYLRPALDENHAQILDCYRQEGFQVA